MKTYQARWAEVAPGFEVRQSIPFAGSEGVGPIILFDHFGPKPMAPGRGSGTGAHPHAGFETLSYLLEGRSSHQDSLGNHSVMGPGDAQWMRAGSGIVHDEGLNAEMAQSGGKIQGFQIWINLPAAHKHAKPEYLQIAKEAIPSVEITPGVTARVIAGEYGGVTGPLKTFAQPLIVHLEVAPGVATSIAVKAAEAAMYVAQGDVQLGGTPASEGTMASLNPGGEVVEVKTSTAAHLFLIGGDPLDAPLARYGPFVMNTTAQLRDSIERYQAGEFGSINVLP